jgi:hypothetical protein
MNRQDTLHNLCNIVSVVGREAFQHKLPHDCFCGHNVPHKRLSDVENAQVDPEILAWLANAVMEKLARDAPAPLHEGGGTWTKGDLRRAFVRGAKWWEFYKTGATMWGSDQRAAEEEAEKRFPQGRPL